MAKVFLKRVALLLQRRCCVGTQTDVSGALGSQLLAVTEIEVEADAADASCQTLTVANRGDRLLGGCGY